MSSQYQLKVPAEQAKEMPMVDLAFEVLKAANTPFYYRDLMAEIAALKGFSDDQVMQVIAQLYTEINVDGRFACVGNNLWGLKRWYPVDNKTDDALGNTKRPRIINDDDDDDLDDEDPFVEEEEDTYAEGEEDFDKFDEDREELPDEEADEEGFEDEESEEDLDEVVLEEADEGLEEEEEFEDEELDEEDDED